MRIKKFTLLTLTLMMMSVVAFAQQTDRKAVRDLEKQSLTKEQVLQFKREEMQKMKADVQSKYIKPAASQIAKKQHSLSMPAQYRVQVGKKVSSPNRPNAVSARRSAEDFPIITIAPEGTVKYYQRAGDYTYRDNGGTTADTQSGKMQIVFAAGNEVFMKNPVYEFNMAAQLDAYVSGTLSADGKTITVPLGQNLYYNYSYDAAFITAIGENFNYENGTATQNTEITEITYTIDDEAGTITMNGTSEDKRLAVFWSDGYGWTGFSEWNTVLTEFINPYTVVTPPAGLETETWTFAAIASDGSNEGGVERTLQIGFDGNDVYVQGIGYYMPMAWIKGTLSADGKSITFDSHQYYGAYADEYDMWFNACDRNTYEIVPVTVAYDAEAGTITWPETSVILDGVDENTPYFAVYYSEIVATIKGTAPAPNEIPIGLQTEEWSLKAQRLSANGLEEYKAFVYVGFVDNDVYVQGIFQSMPESFAKGTLDPQTNKVTFKIQNIGTYYDAYFEGYRDYVGFEDVVMAYDAEKKTLTLESPDYIVLNANWLLLDPNDALTEIVLNEIADEAATPMQPEISAAYITNPMWSNVYYTIPTESVDGNLLLRDKLYYQLYSDVNKEVNPIVLTPDQYPGLTEQMTEIPYNFADYVNYDVFNTRLYLHQTDAGNWNKIGIKSIYYGGGERRESEMFWYVIVPYRHGVVFVPADDVSIQNGKATVLVNGEKIEIDADGKAEIPETYTVTLKATSGYRFLDVTATGTEVTMDDYGLTASFEMPADDVTVNYQMREFGKNIIFTSTNDFSIQGGQASVDVNGNNVTEQINENGLIIDVVRDASVTLNAIPGFKLANVQASYTEKPSGVNYELHDSFGDGWNGNAINIVKTSTGDIVATLTIDSGEEAEGFVELEGGQTYDFVWVSGWYASECSYTITDSEGNIIINDTAGNGMVTGYTAPAGGSGSPIDLDVIVDPYGQSATFLMPSGNVNVAYTLERLGYPVTVPAGQYITHFTDKDITIFDNTVQLMSVISVTDNAVNVEAYDAIPALMPMLLYNASDEDKEVWVVPMEEFGGVITTSFTVSGNFKGTLTEKTFTDDDMAGKDYYVCTGKEFVWLRDAGTIATNKCWIELTKNQPQNARPIEFGDNTTGVTGVNNVVADGQWYDLNGRKLERKPTVKGVYMMNGKKHVIK